jgi:hypothetical protein
MWLKGGENFAMRVAGFRSASLGYGDLGGLETPACPAVRYVAVRPKCLEAWSSERCSPCRSVEHWRTRLSVISSYRGRTGSDIAGIRCPVNRLFELFNIV